MTRTTADALRAAGYDPETGARVPARRSHTSRDGATAGNGLAAALAVNAGSAAGLIVTGDASQPRLSRKNRRPEEALQVAIVAYWRPRLVPGARLFATNGELPGGEEQKRRAGRRKDMGYMRGTPDLQARRRGALLWLECKALYRTQTPEQVVWAAWAIDDCGDGYAVVNSVEDAGAALQAWGMVA